MESMDENRIEIIKIEHFESDLDWINGCAMRKCLFGRSSMFATHLLQRRMTLV